MAALRGHPRGGYLLLVARPSDPPEGHTFVYNNVLPQQRGLLCRDRANERDKPRVPMPRVIAAVGERDSTLSAHDEVFRLKKCPTTLGSEHVFRWVKGFVFCDGEKKSGFQ